MQLKSLGIGEEDIYRRSRLDVNSPLSCNENDKPGWGKEMSGVPSKYS